MVFLAVRAADSVEDVLVLRAGHLTVELDDEDGVAAARRHILRRLLHLPFRQRAAQQIIRFIQRPDWRFRQISDDDLLLVVQF